MGFIGCGKTHWGKEFRMILQIPFFDLDAKIEESEGKKIEQIFEESGEEYFRHLEKEILYLISESHETFVMATGGGTPCFFNNVDYLKKQGTVIWINCSVDCLFRRLVLEKDRRPLISNIPTEQLRSFIVKKFSNRKIFYQQAHIILNEDDINIEQVLDKIFRN